MEILYIINPNTFKGNVMNTMHVSGAAIDNYQSAPVDYMDGVTFAEYNEQNGGELVALHWDAFYDEYYEPYLRGLQGEWVEITEEQWWDALECLPPMRWTRNGDKEFFFISEAYTQDIHSCYVRVGTRYYTARRSIRTPDDELYSLAELTEA